MGFLQTLTVHRLQSQQHQCINSISSEVQSMPISLPPSLIFASLSANNSAALSPSNAVSSTNSSSSYSSSSHSNPPSSESSQASSRSASPASPSSLANHLGTAYESENIFSAASGAGSSSSSASSSSSSSTTSSASAATAAVSAGSGRNVLLPLPDVGAFQRETHIERKKRNNKKSVHHTHHSQSQQLNSSRKGNNGNGNSNGASNNSINGNGNSAEHWNMPKTVAEWAKMHEKERDNFANASSVNSLKHHHKSSSLSSTTSWNNIHAAYSLSGSATIPATCPSTPMKSPAVSRMHSRMDLSAASSLSSSLSMSSSSSSSVSASSMHVNLNGGVRAPRKSSSTKYSGTELQRSLMQQLSDASNSKQGENEANEINLHRRNSMALVSGHSVNIAQRMDMVDCATAPPGGVNATSSSSSSSSSADPAAVSALSSALSNALISQLPSISMHTSSRRASDNSGIAIDLSSQDTTASSTSSCASSPCRRLFESSTLSHKRCASTSLPPLCVYCSTCCLESFSTLGRLGEGSFGTVYAVRDSEDRMFAVKKSRKPFFSKAQREKAMQEVRSCVKLFVDPAAPSSPRSLSGSISSTPAATGASASAPASASILLSSVTSPPLPLSSSCPASVLSLLSQLDLSSYLVKFFASWERSSHLYIQMQYFPLGTLKTYFENLEEPLDEACVWSFALDILLAAYHVHSCGLLHFDIKPSNLLLAENGRLCLGDFGTTAAMRSQHSSQSSASKNFMGLALEEAEEGDSTYLSPELMAGTGSESLLVGGLVGPESDLFSAGLVLFELAADVRLPRRGQAWQDLRNEKIDFDGVDWQEPPSAHSGNTPSSPLAINVTLAGNAMHTGVHNSNNGFSSPHFPAAALNGSRTSGSFVPMPGGNDPLSPLSPAFGSLTSVKRRRRSSSHELPFSPRYSPEYAAAGGVGSFPQPTTLFSRSLSAGLPSTHPHGLTVPQANSKDINNDMATSPNNPVRQLSSGNSFSVSPLKLQPTQYSSYAAVVPTSAPQANHTLARGSLCALRTLPMVEEKVEDGSIAQPSSIGSSSTSTNLECGTSSPFLQNNLRNSSVSSNSSMGLPSSVDQFQSFIPDSSNSSSSSAMVGSPPSHCVGHNRSPALRALIRSMLRRRPADRPSILQLLAETPQLYSLLEERVSGKDGGRSACVKLPPRTPVAPLSGTHPDLHLCKPANANTLKSLKLISPTRGGNSALRQQLHKSRIINSAGFMSSPHRQPSSRTTRQPMQPSLGHPAADVSTSATALFSNGTPQLRTYAEVSMSTSPRLPASTVAFAAVTDNSSSSANNNSFISFPLEHSQMSPLASPPSSSTNSSAASTTTKSAQPPHAHSPSSTVVAHASHSLSTTLNTSLTTLNDSQISQPCDSHLLTHQQLFSSHFASPAPSCASGGSSTNSRQWMTVPAQPASRRSVMAFDQHQQPPSQQALFTELNGGSADANTSSTSVTSADSTIEARRRVRAAPPGGLVVREREVDFHYGAQRNLFMDFMEENDHQ